MANTVASLKFKVWGEINHPITGQLCRLSITIVPDKLGQLVLRAANTTPTQAATALGGAVTIELADLAPFQRCRVCGCTEEDCQQCVKKTGAPCYWVASYLCSACFEQPAGPKGTVVATAPRQGTARRGARRPARRYVEEGRVLSSGDLGCHAHNGHRWVRAPLEAEQL